MGARQSISAETARPADRPAKSGGSRLPPAVPMLRVQRTAGNRVAAAVARRALQRLDDDELAAIRKDRAQKKKLEQIQAKYSDNFVNGAHRDYHGAETWDYWVQKATSLEDLDKRITDLLKAAVDYKARTPAPVKQPIQVPPQSSSGSSLSISSPVVPGPPPSPSSPSLVVPGPAPGPSSAVPGPGKKKKKFTKFDPTTVPGPPPTAWGPGMSPPSSSSSAYKPPPVPDLVDARNADVAGLIKHQPPGALRTVGPGSIGPDTIYFELTVTEAPTTPVGYHQPLQRVWNLEIHYHPVPTSSNYLHVKMRAGTSPQNLLPISNWLVDRAVFKAAVTKWNSLNPDRQSPHTWS